MGPLTLDWQIQSIFSHERKSYVTTYLAMYTTSNCILIYQSQGVYTAFFTATWYQTPFWLVIIISMVVCAIIGVSMEKLAYKPLRYKPRLATLITALGVSLFMENFC